MVRRRAGSRIIMFDIGQVLTKENYTKGAIWCNANNAHIEKQDGRYIIVENATSKHEPTLEEQVAKLEAETGLTRVMREMVLAENSGASDYVKAKANEIEDLAKQLRTTEENPETVDNTQNKEYNSFGDTKQ